jgi:hypothetical protein
MAATHFSYHYYNPQYWSFNQCLSQKSTGWMVLDLPFMVAAILLGAQKSELFHQRVTEIQKQIDVH